LSPRQDAPRGSPHLAQVKLRVGAVTLDPRDGRAVILLVHGESGRVFPLWVGDDEAAAVARALRPAPLGPSSDTQGLLAAAVASLGASVEHVEITGIVDRVVTATIALGDAEGTTILPARPSDAVALALRMNAPIFVHDELLSQVASRVADAEARTGSRTAAAEPVQLSQAERWNQLLAHLSTSRSPKSYEG
jgi:bifunctional DNase/RNase